MIGQTLSHYEIVEQIGRGGMGVVYRARDTRLGRDVALKLLPEDAAGDGLALDRFRREARTASTLNHPNICTVHDVDEADGRPFIVTELLKGRTLKAHVGRRPLGASELLRLAVQIVDALKAAHENGIVHRDIKSTNIFVTREGQAKILDFGLAKVMQVESDSQTNAHASSELTEELTAPGTAVGTFAYMSPEQARGEPLDARTDLFSFGIVLYEMATGRPAFEGPSASVVIQTILDLDPVPPSRKNPNLPPEVDHIVARALEKDVALRYQSASDLAADLERCRRAVETGTSGAPPAVQRRRVLGRLVTASLLVGALALTAWFGLRSGPRPEADTSVDSLAVLPFENQTGDGGLDYLGEGLSDSLTNSFSQLRDLRVVHRSRVFPYKGQATPVDEVGRELGVRVVLAGQVTRRGDRLVIAAQLVDVEEGQLWGDRYARQPDDLLSIEGEIASQIAGRLRIELRGDEEQRLARRRTDSVEAYDLYLKGLYHWNQVDPVSLKDAVSYFTRAAEADTEYALPHMGLANVYSTMGYMGMGPPGVIWPQVKASAERAMELDEDLAGAHAALGHALLFMDWDWPASRNALDRALELDPDYGPAHHWIAHYWMVLGDMEKGLQYSRSAVELEPLDLILRGHEIYFLWTQGRAEELSDRTAQTAEVQSEFWAVFTGRGLVHQIRGEHEEAVQELERAAEASNRHPLTLIDLGHAYALAGQRENAESVIAEMDGKSRELGYSLSVGIGVIHAALGDLDEAFEAFEAFEQGLPDRDPYLLFLETFPWFEPVRDDPRYDELVRRVGFP